MVLIRKTKSAAYGLLNLFLFVSGCGHAQRH
jgi:hypothetical protein